ncbi:MAG: MmgE/PrpD family protein [Pseudomonadota bacterium]
MPASGIARATLLIADSNFMQVELSQHTQRLAAYIANATARPLDAAVVEKTKHHIVDTLAAAVSGRALPAGEALLKFFALQGGTPEATVFGTSMRTTAINAAMANAMLAHADETDDSHLTSRSHLGCGVVPAAFAVGEREGASGMAVIRSVALGYDIGARVCHALGTDQLYNAGHSTHTFAPTFGAAAAAGALAGLNIDQCRWLLSYTAQQASGVNCWQRDLDHVEKAFDFGGMAGRNGVTAALMVQCGYTGVDDVLTGPRNFLFAFSPDPKPALFVEQLGERFEILLTNIKKWSVGSPIQAALDSTQAIVLEHDLAPEDVAAIVVRMSDQESHVVDNREIPDINLQHMVAVMALERTVTFAASHDESRLRDPAIAAMRDRVELVPDPALPRRHPVVRIETRDGASFEHATDAVRGTPDNPMTRDEVHGKARDLIAMVLGETAADAVLERLWRLDEEASVQPLARLLATH